MNLFKSNLIKNRFFYSIWTMLLYLFLYLLLSLQYEHLFQPLIGGLILLITILFDLYLAAKQLRIYLRLIIILGLYFLIKSLLLVITTLASPADTYNFFDHIPFLFQRDTIVSLVFILFYFFFEAIKIKKQNRLSYYLTTLLLIGLFVYFLKIKNFNIHQTIFKNYLIYSLFLVLITILFLLRHISFYHGDIKRRLIKKDLLLLLLLFFPILVILLTITLQEHLKDANKTNNALFNPGLFQFDFSNFIQLKDEIKQSDDRVLIMELSGADQYVNKRITRGWNRQIYLKRFSLEQYQAGGFKIADKYQDPQLPPVYLSGYMWKMKNIPLLLNRIDIIQTLYLINIDSASLMGSELLTQVIPLTPWQDSPYKQIYQSHSSIFDDSNLNMMIKKVNQNQFLSQLSPGRKKVLLDWGTPKNEGRIQELARTITQGYTNPLYQALAIQQYLINNYYYSLKPGLAKNKNQLEYFLFESKKGYCTYYAFAMTLMLRSLGVAARVAVGFAPDMNNHTLNFYEIRGLDAHAWVEVYLDQFGWITFDPTATEVAPGEEYEFSLGNKEERDDLIQDILKNKDKMKKITREMEEKQNQMSDLFSHLKRSVRWAALLLIMLLIVLVFSLIYLRKKIDLIRYQLEKEPRKKIRYLYRHLLSQLLSYSYSIRKNESLQEYALRLKKSKIIDIQGFTHLYQKAQFHEQEEFLINPRDLADIKKRILAKLKKFPLKKRLFSFFNLSLLWRKILPLALIIFFYSISPLSLTANTIEQYISKARHALDEDYYDQALSILNEAEKKFPSAFQPNYEKGKIYYKHELHENAIDEFMKTKTKNYYSEILYIYLANALGKIGRDDDAVAQYEEAFARGIKTKKIYDNLGWMYYKAHNVNNGIKVIQEGLKKYPASADLLMTLGTLYSEAHDYHNSKKAYLRAIDQSYGSESNNFRAIVYYNLSLLEDSFLKYENAYQYARASLSIKQRSSAHMQLNYLYTSALKLKKAFGEVIKASRYEPKTLFPEMSLINIYLLSGNIDQALELAENLYQSKDFGWILYFGLSIEEFHNELYYFLSTAYQLKANQILFTGKKDFFHSLIKPFQKAFYLIKSYVFQIRFTNSCIKIGQKKLNRSSNITGSHLIGLKYIYDGYKKVWSSKASKILKITEPIELNINPRKKRFYDLEKAIIQKSYFFFKKNKKENLVRAMQQLNQEWEQEYKTEALIELIKLTRGEEKKQYIGQLFLTHPQFLPINNIKTPINILFSDQINPALQNKLLQAIKKRAIQSSKKSQIALEINPINATIFNVSIYNQDQLHKNFTITAESEDSFSSQLFEKIFITQF